MSSISLWNCSEKSFWTRWLPVLAIALLLAGCNNPQSTVDTIHKEITDFKAAPDEKKQLAIEQSLNKLQSQVEVLEQKNDPRAEHFRSELVTLRADYQSAKMAKALQDAKNAIQGLGEAFKDGAKNVGDVFKSSGSTK